MFLNDITGLGPLINSLIAGFGGLAVLQTGYMLWMIRHTLRQEERLTRIEQRLSETSNTDGHPAPAAASNDSQKNAADQKDENTSQANSTTNARAATGDG